MAPDYKPDGPAEGTGRLIHWLLDSDPAIRWQVMRDLTGAAPEVVAAERSHVAVKGWGARLLDLQDEDGNWGGGPWVRDSWASTLETLMLLREMGVEPSHPRTKTAIALVRNRSDWGPYHDHAPFFEGESEPCINGRVLACGAYFGAPSDRLVDRLLAEQLPDGGWNCEAPPSTRSSFNSTICVLEGLLEYESVRGTVPAVRDARLRAQEYLLERKLFTSLSSGEVIARDRKGHHDWREFFFPTRWRYDVLWGLDFLRKAGADPDDRLEHAIDLVVARRNREGQWPLAGPHAGTVHFEMETAEGKASRWVTLRACRVLDWFQTPLLPR